MKKALIIIILVILWGYGEVFGQERDSKTTVFYLNNLPDTLPPTIRILSPEIPENGAFKAETKEVDIIGEVNDKSAIRFVTVNSELSSTDESGVFTSRQNLYPGLNRFRIIAMDANNNRQEAFINIEYIPPVISLADKIMQESQYYGLVIGIDNYEDPDLDDLDNPIMDAEKVYKTLTEFYTFPLENITILKDAKRKDIVEALDDLARKVTPADNVVIFYAGHGMWDEKANIGYWLPSDAYLNSTANWFRNSALVDYLKVIDSKHTLLITDACFAGSIFKTRSGARNQEKAFEILYGLSSRKAMTSGTLTEVPDNSAFTRYLIERLEENKNTYLSSSQLFNSFRIAVLNNSGANPLHGEIQNVGDEGGDFIFIRKDRKQERKQAR